MLLSQKAITVCLCMEHPGVAQHLALALHEAGLTTVNIADRADAIHEANVVIFQPSARTAHYLNEYGSSRAWIAYVDDEPDDDLEAYRAQGVREVLYSDELAPRQLQRSLSRAFYFQQAQQQLNQYDSLTGLYSNRGFLEATDQALFTVADSGRLVSMLALDIRSFNDINSRFGFNFADHVLTQVADRMRSSLGPLAKIARLGGDEFLILLENLPNREVSDRLVKRVQNLFDLPFEIQEQTLALAVDIGVVTYPQTLGSAEDLLRKAHDAMHRAKKQQSITVYRHAQGRLDNSNDDMERSLRHGLRRGEFELFYQPRVCLQRQELLGMEALIRWHHPQRGLLGPSEFIQVAEASGLIVPLGYWIIDQVCQDLQHIQECGFSDVVIASNLSFRQLQDEQFCHVMPRLLTRPEVDTKHLEFELTETAVLTDPERAMTALQEVNRLGVEISLDDFGTGYSSLSHIRQFPISTIKIDRSFTQRVTLDHEADSIVRSIINLAHDLNMKVVAEGVENADQLNFLVDNQCDQVQGFLFSHPRPLWEVLQLIDHTLTAFNRSKAI